MPYRKTFTIPLEFITKAEIIQRINKNTNFVLVDTGITSNKNRYKIKGAITIPLSEVTDRRRELAGFEETIVYCKNSSCAEAKLAAMCLKLLHIPNVKVYAGGFDEWKEYKLSIEEV